MAVNIWHFSLSGSYECQPIVRYHWLNILARMSSYFGKTASTHIKIEWSADCLYVLCIVMNWKNGAISKTNAFSYLRKKGLWSTSWSTQICEILVACSRHRTKMSVSFLEKNNYLDHSHLKDIVTQCYRIVVTST